MRSTPPHARPPRIRLGTQGWNYAAWLGAFYPSGTRPATFLDVYARAFDTVEVDATFYAVPPAHVVQRWAERTPPDFQFALKLPRAITHDHRLRGGEAALDEFLDRARLLGPKLGPVLVQLGPDFGPDEFPALAGFVPLLPPDLRVAIEFRDRGWFADAARAADLLALLAAHRIAPALSDGPWVPRRWLLRLAERLTEHAATDFAYVRWMGPNRDLLDHTHVQVDRTAELDLWADVLSALAPALGTVYGYVSNFYAGHAPANVRDLQYRLGQPVVRPEALAEQLPLL